MHPDRLRGLLAAVAAGELDTAQALEQIKLLPYEDLGFAKVDHHRHVRVGVPEVVFCLSKTADQVRAIVRSIAERGSNVLATRMSEELFAALQPDFPAATYHAAARAMVIEVTPAPPVPGTVAVVCAGTSDIPVAEEAAVTLEALGNTVERIYDVGVAGLHRLLAQHTALAEARCLVVVAGMEGALASVIGGLVETPVIGVPTSVGYGASFGGIAALLSMLNSCASGVAVVNIDNGFGAGYMAHLITRQRERPE